MQPFAIGFVPAGEIVQRMRDGRMRTNIGDVATLDPTERRNGKTIIRIRP